MSTYRNRRANGGDANGDGGVPQELMCFAQGCPNRWSVDMGNGRLCSAHDRAEPHRWPEITQVQQWDETERARLRGEAKAELPSRFTDPVRMRAVFRRYAQKVREREQDPLRWARRLKAREEGGEKLCLMQREAWRNALRADRAKLDIDAGADA
jgi:hypothetical protein